MTLSASDANTWVASTRYRVNGGTLTTYTAPFAVSAEGITTLEYSSTDGAGNTEATKTATVRIDKTAPAVSDDATSAWTEGPAHVHLTATDTASGLQASLLHERLRALAPLWQRDRGVRRGHHHGQVQGDRRGGQHRFGQDGHRAHRRHGAGVER